LVDLRILTNLRATNPYVHTMPSIVHCRRYVDLIPHRPYSILYVYTYILTYIPTYIPTYILFDLSVRLPYFDLM
jgi:hypothetical protein